MRSCIFLALHAASNMKGETVPAFQPVHNGLQRRTKMTRKDSEKDSERPHYYSQFWLDIAAGRRTIGGPRPDEEGAEPELAEPIAPLRRPTRSASYEDPIDGHADGHVERFLHPVAEPLATEEEFSEPDEDEVDLETADVTGSALPEEVVDDIDIPDMDLTSVEEDSEDEDEDEEEGEEDEEAVAGEEDEEDDIGWGGTGARGRKRNKPVRPKLPPKKVPRREPRRGY